MAIDERRLNELNTASMNEQGIQIDALDNQTMVVNMGRSIRVRTAFCAWFWNLTAR